MTMKLTNDIRPAELPIYCSACGCQDTAKRHVDFDAACDRGYGTDENVPISMDDLIICETCLRSAAILVGMVDGTEPLEKIAVLERRLDEEQKRANKAAAYADRMEQALAARPAPVKVSRPRGRPPKTAKEAIPA